MSDIKSKIRRIPPKNVTILDDEPAKPTKPCKSCGHVTRAKKAVDDQKTSKCRLCGDEYTIKTNHVKSDRHATIKYLLDKVLSADADRLSQLKQTV